ncbi:peptidase domain-containing ABC transporter [Winogradskyella sediminis]|uniref:ABC-type bacteriocin/lantibiotic exporter, contains an N-terminal double-glycine peptidase domain n=1 Tax=Winogradskyella sediminis TaxID=1382466 RepID=A0A1H1UF87_9FLAO|nr:ATP-binding cassette domain-containing protein [Winogradskyella sediminis]REG85197.1 ABC-type bacteriocin/lantibiotic exporter with double-glycine peptidase domain [Winogradskyella sediminis]SDS71098.1 ABC-type bacteriocin/lantibiotic exporter, contains an N-terminal double-glycine peptidase domain [Winogradskyella sediminis]
MKKKEIMSPWQRFVGLIKLEKRDILQVIYYAIFSGLLGLTLPLGIQAIINLLQGAQVSTSWGVLVVLVTIGVAFVGVLQLMQMRIVETIQQRIFTRASFEFTYRFPKITMRELRNYYPPELANRFFDTLNIQKGLAKILVDIPAAIIQIVFALVLLSFYHPFFIAFGMLLLILIYVVFKFTAQTGMDTSLIESKHKYRVAHWIQEVARAIVSFKLSGQTNLAINKNDDLVNDYLKARESHFRILVIQFIQMIGFKVIVTAGLLLIGGLLVLNQEMNIGQFVAAEIIILLVISSVEKLILRLESFYDVLTSLEKMGQVVDKELENQEGDKPNFNDDFSIELDNVSYGVPNRELHILRKISLKINPKTKLLIRGESGSGKSSLLRLIAGVLEPTIGRVFVNDYVLDNINLNHYRAHLGMSLADETPFEGTIRENITFGNDQISEAQLRWAIEKVELNEFVKQSPQGLSTVLYPEGKQTSYTISKKIVLARAIVNKPRILILEDPLEYFEPNEVNRIISFLTDNSSPWALVVVSKTNNWIQNCTQVITLKNGEII